MRVVVFSDTHGNGAVIDRIVSDNSSVSEFIFLGDGEKEIDKATLRYTDKNFHTVRGNCDFNSKKPDFSILELEGHRILFTHGHTFGVNFTLDRLVNFALYNNADIVLFGHLHVRHYEYRNKIHILNPSSASLPRDVKPPAYAFIDIEESGGVCGHVNL